MFEHFKYLVLVYLIVQIFYRQMADIIDNEELDKDTVGPDVISQQFSKPYELLTEKAISLKKSYINNIAGTQSLKFVISLSDNSIEVYELNGSSLTKTCRLSGHSKVISDVVFSPKEDHLIYSSGQDGVIKLWDTRSSGVCVQEYKDDEEDELKPYDCMDVSCNGRVLCSGSQLVKDDAYLVFWDQRNTKPLGGYWNSHTDDISQVKFHKEKCEVLATGSLDGLLNVFNIMEQTEDDALQYSLNVENSVQRITWLDSHTAACTTQSNDLQLWNTESGDLLKSYTRDKVAKSIKRSKGDDCYLVDMFTASDGSHNILAGSYAGDGACLRSVTVTEKRLQPRTNFTGNRQNVSCCYYDKQRNILVTGGESGLLSVWSAGEDAATAPTPHIVHKMNKLHVNRHKPY